MVPLRSQSGFSLVELSIVLVILGLLTGGILGGQALIRAAELRKFPVEKDRVVVAINSFEDRFGSLPGDFDLPTAARLWQSRTGCTSGNDGQTNPRWEFTQCGSDCPVWLSPCNARNGLIDTMWESTLFWRHLTLTDLYLPGVDTTPNRSYVAGEIKSKHMPSINSSSVMYVFSSGQDNFLRIADISNPSAVFGLTSPYYSDSIRQSNISPADLMGVDIKVDDGLPNSGVLRGQAGTNASGACLLGGNYVASNNGKACIIDFRLGL